MHVKLLRPAMARASLARTSDCTPELPRAARGAQRDQVRRTVDRGRSSSARGGPVRGMKRAPRSGCVDRMAIGKAGGGAVTPGPAETGDTKPAIAGAIGVATRTSQHGQRVALHSLWWVAGSARQHGSSTCSCIAVQNREIEYAQAAPCRSTAATATASMRTTIIRCHDRASTGAGYTNRGRGARPSTPPPVTGTPEERCSRLPAGPCVKHSTAI